MNSKKIKKNSKQCYCSGIVVVVVVMGNIIRCVIPEISFDRNFEGVCVVRTHILHIYYQDDFEAAVSGHFEI